VDDEKLMQQIAAGEETAFRLLVERHEQSVFAFLFHLVGTAEDAHDLSQETFLRVWRQAGKYRSRGKFQSWLLRIAGNLARSLLRRRKIVRWVRWEPWLGDRPDPRPNPEANLVATQRQAAVRAAIARLPWRQRQAVVLRRYQDLSYREIASVLGTSAGAVESLLQRATAALRRELAGKVDLT
jgi:RNA polymerase sigma-70 factor (ECF subfamily)